MIDRLLEAYEYRDFLVQLVYQQLRQRYQGSVLGFLWTLVQPALFFVSFSLVFSYLNHWDLRDYGIYFFSGYMFWNFFAVGLSMATDSVVANAAYVTRVYVPRILLPLATVVVNLVDLAASFVILLILMVILRASFSPSMLFLPISAVLAIAAVTGACLLGAVANVFLRDFRHLIQSVLFLWFFLSPILWLPKTFSPRMQAVLAFNPVVPFLHLFQDPIWKGVLPSLHAIVLSLVFACGLLVAGVALFLKTERKFYYYL